MPKKTAVEKLAEKCLEVEADFNTKYIKEIKRILKEFKNVA